MADKTPNQGVLYRAVTLEAPSGFYHNPALKSDRTVWALGNNGYGQLGNGVMEDRFVPVQVSGLTNVAAGDFHGDGKNDLVWQNTQTADVTVWYMDGFTWTGSYDFLAHNIPTDWQVVGVGAFSGGSGNLHQADLVWRNRLTGDVSIWYMDDAAAAGATDYLARHSSAMEACSHALRRAAASG